MNNILSGFSNVLIIGCGGAGLRAAIEVKMSGLNVKVLGKRLKSDAHTSLAAGGINAALGNLDHNDSWKQHFIDTYIEGYGIGDPSHIEIMVKEAPDFVKEVDNWGANFEKLPNGKLDQRFFGAHKYRRTCYSGDYSGQSILNALLKKSSLLGIPIDDEQYVTDLLVKNNVCFGAVSFNIKNGQKCINLADSVVLCTGGHTRIWKINSSRKYENNGDGLYLGLKAGCSLIDMEMVQFHPTGMVLPEEIAGTLVTEAVRGEGGRLLNINGERFMKKYDKKRMELSTRDRVALANYTEILEGRCTANGGVFLDISHRDKEFIMRKLPRIYNQFLEYQNLDISQKPMEVAPTAHYSMGGIKVDADNHSACVEGLFAAGEVAGGLHGANRLGGNSLSEILVFGSRAGLAAVNYSRNSSKSLSCELVIKKCLNSIDEIMHSGKNEIEPMERDLQSLMWLNCGVVKDEQKLKDAIKSILKIKNKSQSLVINIENGNYRDLISAYNLKASIISAEATLLSSLNRKESRGSHQRNDYKLIRKKENVNYIVRLKNNELEISKQSTKDVPKEFKNYKFILESKNELKGKLLE